MTTRVDRYLNRIAYAGDIARTYDVLKGLQEAHLMHVPFENLDIHHHRLITMENAWHKIVVQRRGGFCYELNYAFYQLLQEIGFDVKLVSARVFDKEKGYGPEFDHMAIVSTLVSGDYLVDVGFGEFALHPLRMELNIDLDDPRDKFRMTQYNEHSLLVNKQSPEVDFQPEYLFSETERSWKEFQEMCTYHQTSPESHFTQKRICSLATPQGRISVSGNTLIITNNGVRTEQLLTEPEVEQALRNYFSINLG